MLASISETSFQLSLPREAILQLVRDGELLAIEILDRKLIVAESIEAFIKRQRKAVEA